jgi:uncharacterized protein YbjT (DUF2867 family)
VDLRTGEGLEAALAGVDAVVDTTNTSARDEAGIVEFFTTATSNLLAAAEGAGVGHHVLLSIVGLDRGQRVPHYEGKRVQERLVRAAGVPWTIVRATQFHDFAAMVAEWTERDGVARIAPLLVQPVDIGDLGEVLAEVATGAPLRRHLDVARAADTGSGRPGPAHVHGSRGFRRLRRPPIRNGPRARAAGAVRGSVRIGRR